jgi:N-acetylmuramoyl-L-alanine amidase
LALAAPAPPARAVAAAKCDPARFRVVLDVGHTAEVPGAISARGLPEYAYNLRLAEAIERTLGEAGFVNRVLLVTTGRSFAGLAQRVARANALPADLFISIHHDSVPVRFLEVWDDGGVARNFSNRFSGHSIFVSHENPQRAASLRFALLLGAELKARGLTYTPHYAYPEMLERRRELLDRDAGVYRFNALIVLRKTRMPAVLLEAGSIINRDEEAAMATPERQAVIAAAVTEAVRVFCAAR